MKQQIFIALFLTLTACNTVPKSDKTEKMTTEQQATDIPFATVENYFILNTVTAKVPLKISSQEEFDTYFGTAATMAPKSKPTTIDFSKEYAIVIDLGDTQNKTDIEALRLSRKDDNLILTYNLKQGDNQMFTTRPFLMIRVSNSYTGNIQISRQ